MGLKILYIGEITGKPGVYCVKKLLGEIKKEYDISLTIANCEGATGGFGLGKNHSVYLKKMGIDVETTGEKGFYKKDLVEHIQKAPYVLRPANYPYGVPGRGWRIFSLKDSTGEGEVNAAVLVLLGNSGFSRTHLANPFLQLPDLAEKLKRDAKVVILDFHAATTAEKQTMLHLADGKVSAVIGSHTKVLTADERITDSGTAYITDTGRTGSLNSAGGLSPDVEIKKFLTQVPERSKDCWENLELQGVVIDIDSETGRAAGIERIRKPCPVDEIEEDVPEINSSSADAVPEEEQCMKKE